MYELTVKSTMDISQKFMAFSEYMNFKDHLISKCLFGVFNSPEKRTKTIWLEVPQ